MEILFFDVFNGIYRSRPRVTKVLFVCFFFLIICAKGLIAEIFKHLFCENTYLCIVIHRNILKVRLEMVIWAIFVVNRIFSSFRNKISKK